MEVSVPYADMFFEWGTDMEFLKGIEQSGICSWIRESSSIWAYPTFIFFALAWYGISRGNRHGI